MSPTQSRAPACSVTRGCSFIALLGVIRLWAAPVCAYLRSRHRESHSAQSGRRDMDCIFIRGLTLRPALACRAPPLGDTFSP